MTDDRPSKEMIDLLELQRIAVEALETPCDVPRHERDLVVPAEVLIGLIDARREFEVVQALFGSGNSWREITASQIHDRMSAIMLELTKLRVKVKRYEPVDTYNGLSIEQWKTRAEAAEARLANETEAATPAKTCSCDPVFCARAEFPRLWASMAGVVCRDKQ